MAAPMAKAVVDGSMLEGGGQILRYAAALAAISCREVQVQKVRAKRDKPGLRPQHLTGLQLVTSLCNGKLTGGAVGSSDVTLQPGTLARCGRYSADTKTAGSCTLMVQASLPVLVFAQPPDGGWAGAVWGYRCGEHARDAAAALSVLELRGGTDADMAPPAGYLAEVLVPLLKRLYGAYLQQLEVLIVRRGFFPKGNGILSVRVPAMPYGKALPALDLTRRGKLTEIQILVFTAGRVQGSVGGRMLSTAEAHIRRALKGLGPDGLGVSIVTETVEEDEQSAFGDGCGILLTADTDTGCRLGASAKGERGVPAEAVAEQAAAELVETLRSGTCVDQWMQDQLIIWMALAEGTSRMVCAEPTLHTRTAMVVAEQLLPGVRFRVHRPGGALVPPSSAGGDGGDGAAEGQEPRSNPGPASSSEGPAAGAGTEAGAQGGAAAAAAGGARGGGGGRGKRAHGGRRGASPAAAPAQGQGRNDSATDGSARAVVSASDGKAGAGGAGDGDSGGGGVGLWLIECDGAGWRCAIGPADKGDPGPGEAAAQGTGSGSAEA